MAGTKKEDVVETDKEMVSYKQPCDIGQDSDITSWEEDKDKNKKYGYDIYKVNSLCGCGDVWICTVTDKDGRRSCCFEPNIEIFFTENDVNKALNRIKKTEDSKKLNKWKRRDWFNA